MTATVELTDEEVDALRVITDQSDINEALREATSIFLHGGKHAGLLAVAGRIEFEDDFPDRLDQRAIRDKRKVNGE